MLCLLGHFIHKSDYLLPSDDLYANYYRSAEVFAPNLASKNTAIVKKYAQEVSHGDLELTRLELREKFTYNYLFHSVLYKVSTDVFSSLFADELNDHTVGQIVAASIWFTQLGLYLILLTILCTVLALIDDHGISAATILSLMVLLVAVCVDTKASQILLPSQKMDRSFLEYVQNSFVFVFDTGNPLTLFGSIPRNGAALLLLAAYLCRLKKCYTTSYLLVPVIMLTHFISGFLAFLILLVIDGALRPKIFLVRWMIPVFSFSILLGILNAPTIKLTLSLEWLAAIIFVVSLCFFTIFRVRPFVEHCRRRIIQFLPDELLDPTFFLVGFLITVPLVVIVSLNSEPQNSHLFWARLHGRAYGLFQPCLLASLFLFLVRTNAGLMNAFYRRTIVIPASAVTFISLLLSVAFGNNYANFKDGTAYVETVSPN
jgi:hypothetical protein